MAVFTVITILLIGILYIIVLIQTGMKKWIFVHPFTSILYYFYHHCRSNVYESPFGVQIDFCIGLSFIVYTIAFFHAIMWVKESFCISISNRFFFMPEALRNKITFNLRSTVIISGIVFLIAFWRWRIQLYGSFTDAVFAMYANLPDVEVRPLIERFCVNFYPLLCVLLAYRLFLIAIERTKQWLSMTEISLIMLIMLSQMTTGNRGRTFFIPLLFVMAILIAKCLTNRHLIFSIVKNQLTVLSILLIGLFLTLALTIVRGNEYGSINEIYHDINASSMITGVEQLFQQSEDQSNTVPYCVEMSMETYGSNDSFLGLGYTPYVIATNIIPRQFWSSKPNGFGRQLVIDYYGNFETKHSVGASTFGEGYAAWGYTGGFLYTYLFAFIAGIAAKFFLVLIKHACDYIECWFFALLFFHMSTLYVRGDMLSAWAQSVYPILILVVINFALKLFFVPKR